MTTVRREIGEGTARLRAALKQLAGATLKVGWPEAAKYPTKSLPVAYIASIHEYGYAPKNIPPRMGLRQMIQEKQGEWATFAERGAKIVLNGGNIRQGLDILGAKARGDIVKQIASVQEPILKVSTIEARARLLGLDDPRDVTGTGAKPLVEPIRKDGAQGLLIASVTWLVEGGA